MDKHAKHKAASSWLARSLLACKQLGLPGCPLAGLGHRGGRARATPCALEIHFWCQRGPFWFLVEILVEFW